MNFSSNSPVSPTIKVLFGILPFLPVAKANPNDPVLLTPVVVTAPVSERPLVVSVDPKAPAQPIPAQDGAEALRAISGFNVIRKGGTDGDPVLRGMAGSRLGILLDGADILGGCGNRMDPPTAYVFPGVYDRITVLKGPQSVIHGPGNSAGVVLFERTPRRLMAPAAQLDASLTVGSFGRSDQMLHVRGGTPSSYLVATGTRTYANDYSDGSGRAVPSHYLRWNAHVALGWTPDDDTLVEISGISSDGEAAYADRLMDGAQFARQNVGLRVRRSRISEMVATVEFNTFINAVDHVMDNYSLRAFTPSTMMPGRAASNPDRLTYGARTIATLTPVEALRVTIGADHQGNRHRVRSTNNEFADPYETKFRHRDASFENTGIFAETTTVLSDQTRLVAGVRGDLWEAADHRATLATGMMSQAANPTAEQTRRATLPSGFVRYEHDLRSHTTAFIGVGHAQRFPDYWELFSKETATSISAFNTRAEETTQIDAGFTHHAGSLTVSLSVFASRIHNYILIEGGFAKPAGMMGTRTTTIARNIDGTTSGGEASLRYAFTSSWHADVAVAHTSGSNQTDVRPLAQQPPLEGRVGLNYATPRWTIGALTRLVAPQERYAPNQGNIVGQDIGRSAGFATFALNAAWKPSARCQLTIGLDNLFDRTYAEHLSRGGTMVAGFPSPTVRVNEPGRTLWLKTNLEW